MTWRRLEAGTIDPDIEEGAAARVADPLWFLARQWQVGEFRGEDAATPVMMEAEVQSFGVDRFAVGGQQIKRSATGVPLEALAEREPVTSGPARVRLRLESGEALMRALAAAGTPPAALEAARAAYALDRMPPDGLDPVGHARLVMLARRSPDADELRRAIGRAGDASNLPQFSQLPDDIRSRISAAAKQWIAQEAAMFVEAADKEPTAWNMRRLEYGFGLAAGGFQLDVPEYAGGRLDWYHADVVKQPAEVPSSTTPTSVRVLPVPLRFGGMPAARWWEFEDGDAYFGDLAGGPEDLARSVVAAYATVAGDDWWVVPCTLPIGTVARVTKLRVLDDFGDSTDVAAAAVLDHANDPARPWRWFELAGDRSVEQGAAPLVYLPPVVATVEQSRPIEMVEFRRDEMANLAWAIERRVESMAGRAVDREAGPRPAPLPVPAAGAWRYQLGTDVPDNWVPLVPVRITGDRPDIVLRRGRLASTSSSEANTAKGVILEPHRAFLLCEEELPAGGVRVDRRYQLARSADGGVHLWVGRHKQPSDGPMRRTPLHFDELTQPPVGAAPAPAPERVLSQILLRRS